MLERRGATIQHGPALRIVGLADDTDLQNATRALIESPPDITVATTGIGYRGWIEAADGWGLGEDLLTALGRGEMLARGPKARGAIRASGLVDAWSPESESTAEVLEHLLARGVEGRRIAVQLHGEPLPDVVEALEIAGAEVMTVPVYRWAPPADIGPLDRLLDAVLSGSIDMLGVHQRTGRGRSAGPGDRARTARRAGGRAARSGPGPVRGPGDGGPAGGPGRADRAAAALPAGGDGAHAGVGRALPGPPAPGRRQGDRAARARRAGGRRAAPGTADTDGAAAGARPASGTGGAAQRAARGAARRAPTSTPWRTRSPGCGPRWASRAWCRPSCGAATGSRWSPGPGRVA